MKLVERREDLLELQRLLSIETDKALESHPKLGSSWEGFALENVWRSIGKADEHACFWATRSMHSALGIFLTRPVLSRAPGAGG